LSPTIATQLAEILVRHIGVYVIIVHVFQVGICLKKIKRFVLSRIKCFGIFAYVWQR